MSQYRHLLTAPVTLQEIDSNFSKAHRIVTGSILPIVEQYAKHSSAVWEGSKVRRTNYHGLQTCG